MATSAEQSKLIDKFLEEIPLIIKSADYDEIYGHQLDPKGEYYDEEIAKVLLEKFLKANRWDYLLSKAQLTSTLKWRKSFNPLKAAFQEEHDPKFDVISYTTWYPKNPANEKVVTFNVYGNVKDPLKIFGDTEAFIRWRVGVQEKALQLLNLKDKSNDYMVQIHDYKKLSFLRMDPNVKKSSKEVIKLFQDYFPEILSEKFFVNIPTILSWVFAFVSRFVSEDTRKKFKVLGDGGEVAKYLGSQVPKEYGGSSGKTLEEQRFDFNSEKNTEFKLTSYAAHLLGEQFTQEID